MKRKISKSVLLVLAACFACVLALGTTLARADEGGDATIPVAETVNKLTVKASNADTETDVMNAGAHFDAYLIATGEKDARYETYNYAFEGVFADLQKEYTPSKMDSTKWETITNAAVDIVAKGQATPTKTENLGGTVTGFADGLYLIIVPEAASPSTVYTFSPVIVAVPGVPGVSGGVDENGQEITLYNTAQGNWTHDVTAVIKWSQRPRLGKLTIKKTVEGFSGEGATFNYHVVNTNADDAPFEFSGSIQYTAEKHDDLVISAPAGIDLTVTELYEGARYQLKDPNSNDVHVTLNEENNFEAEVSFVNVPNDSGKSGHGIQNHFVYDKASGKWNLTVDTMYENEDITPKVVEE